MKDNTPQAPAAGRPGVQWLEIDERRAGQRIDNFLLTQLKGVPKSRIYRILRKGEVRVNKGRIKPDYRLQPGDTVRVPPVRVAGRDAAPQPGQSLSSTLKKAVVFEDEQLMALNKPSGLAAHGGSGVNLGLIEALRQIYPNERFLELVHRLDRDTSGCIMVAKSRAALRHLQQQMQQGGIDKCYQALVAGYWQKGLREISAPLHKNQLQSGERVVRVSEQGKRAVTYFDVLQRLDGATLVRARLETGRTHQIRVHCRAAGHALAGDSKYGDPAFNRRMKGIGLKRLFLHAEELSFTLPRGGKKTVRAPLPGDLSRVVEKLKTD